MYLKKVTVALLLTICCGLASAAPQLSAGASPGYAFPIGGNFTRYQPGLALRVDARLTGLQPVIGYGLTLGYAGFKGPKSADPQADSSKFSYRFLPIAVYLFTDLSQVLARSPVLPYLHLGAGPTWWDIRYDNRHFTTGDSTPSTQWDYVLAVTVGAERRFNKVPLSVFAEVSADYITGSHLYRYGPLDEDEAYAVLSAGLRYSIW